MKNNTRMPNSVFVATLVLVATISIVVGILLSRSYDCKISISPDALIQALATLVAVVAATIILPLTVQKFLDGQKAFNAVLSDDLKKLIYELEKVICIYRDYLSSQQPIGKAGRQKILESHTNIVNLANLINTQSSKASALYDFNATIVQPLGESRSNFSDMGLPETIIDDDTYLSIQKNINSVIYKLKQLRYSLH